MTLEEKSRYFMCPNDKLADSNRVDEVSNVKFGYKRILVGLAYDLGMNYERLNN